MIYFGYFSFSGYSFGVEKTNTFIRSRGFLENHTRFKTIMVKFYTRFQTKTGIEFDHNGLKSGMVFKETTGAYKRICLFNSK